MNSNESDEALLMLLVLQCLIVNVYGKYRPKPELLVEKFGSFYMANQLVHWYIQYDLTPTYKHHVQSRHHENNYLYGINLHSWSTTGCSNATKTPR